MEKKQPSNDDYRKAIAQIIANIEKELPVLTNNLQSLTSSQTFVTIPSVVHNICVVFERQAYKFLRPAYNLYKHINAASLTPELQDMVATTQKILSELVAKEDALVNEQYELLNRQIAAAKEKGETVNVKEEERVFNHLEADLSTFFGKVIKLAISGYYHMTEQDLETMREVHSICVSILQEEIEAKQNALSNAKKFLASI